jgi:hypothetical protein
MMLLSIIRLEIVRNFRPNWASISQSPNRLTADRNRYCDRNVALGHYCDTRQRINHKSWVIRCGLCYCQNLAAPQKKNSRNSQKSTSNFKILYRKVRFGLLSLRNPLYWRNQRGTMRHAWYCQNSATVRETDMPVSTHLSHKQSRSENARITSLCMKQHIRNQLSHQHSYSLQPPRMSIHAREVNLVKKLLRKMKSLNKAVSIPNVT